MNGRQIEHRGVVERIVSHGVIVSIVQETACAACAAAQLCHSSEKKEKLVEIPCDAPNRYSVGQDVTIVGEIGLGLRATLWAYVIPLVLLMVVLMVSASFLNAGIAALLALASLIPYYIILYAFRNKMQRRFSFRIKS